jgi:opacity protein-like surface antigen
MMKRLALAAALAACLGLAAAAPAAAPSFQQAFASISQSIQAHQEAGSRGAGSRGRVMASAPKKEKADVVRFELPLDPQGQGRAATSQRCFGVTLVCQATIVEPGGAFDVAVRTDAGSEHAFQRVSAGKPVDFRLETNGGFSSTEFLVEIARVEGQGQGPVVVDMAYDY